jgi:hypothetical protein
MPAPSGADQSDADRTEAALALIQHHENIVASSAAAAGSSPDAAVRPRVNFVGPETGCR